MVVMKIRNSVKVLLLNDNKELLLMCIDDPKTTTVDGKYHGRFWITIGGEIENNETIEQALLREIYEETGIKKEKIEVGPVVWFGELDLILSGIPTRIKQIFIVGKTKQNKISLENLTEEEKPIVKNLKWFSLDEIMNCSEIIYPVVLKDHIQDIIQEKHPKESFEINLAKEPERIN